MGFPRSASLLACALPGASCLSVQAEPVRSTAAPEVGEAQVPEPAQENQRREAEAETESLAASSQNPIADLIKRSVPEHHHLRDRPAGSVRSLQRRPGG
jgi:hypothetical protein